MVRTEVGWNCPQCGSSIVVDAPAKTEPRQREQAEEVSEPVKPRAFNVTA